MSATEAGSTEPWEQETPPLPGLTVVARSTALLVAVGISLGLAGWTLRVGESLTPYVWTNSLPPHARAFVVANIAVGGLAGLFVAALLVARNRVSGTETLRRLSLRLSPLSFAWLVPVLLEWKLWVGRELQFLALVAVLGLATQRLVRTAIATPPVFTRPAPRWLAATRSFFLRASTGWPPFLVVIAAGAFYAAFFAFHTIRNHYRLSTAAMDLGLEDNLVWNAVHWGPLFKTSPLGGPTSSHGGFHQTYFAYLLAIPYRFAPRPQTLLAIQAMLMGFAAVPLYFFAKRRLSDRLACLVAVLFVCYAPLQGANLYDFHYLPLATLFIWLLLYLLEERRYVWAGITLVVTLSIREDVSALLVFMGAYLILTGDNPKAGIVVSTVSAAYFVLLKLVIMPRYMAGTESFIHQYSGLLPEGDRGYGGILKTVIANPSYTLGIVLEREKLVYLAQIIVPLAFLPWVRPIGLLCSTPGFLFTLLATHYPPLIQTSFQYTTYWTTFLFVAIVANLGYMQDREREPTEEAPFWHANRLAWVAALFVCVLLTSNQFGAFFQQNTARGGFGPYRFDLNAEDRVRHDRLYKLIAMVPKDAKIVSSETIVPHVSQRPNSYTMRTGIYDADYMLAWMPPRGDERAPVSDAIKSGRYGVVAESGEFVLAKRGYSSEKNARVVSKYGL
ncbi:MAG TPA: DUF2079 domain-containing protein [Polyangiaceae bacterium]|jgi:uncharacterized membrane protein|nr:DUF2079 domain-containing protein [Polyangiaceae bacterium]